MATEQKRILIRRGNKADLVVTDLQPGELVLALDTNEIGVKTSGGTVLWLATLPESDNNANSSRHFTKYPDGILHEWGYVNDTITITAASAYGSMYLYDHYNLILNQNFVSGMSAHVNIASSGALIGVSVMPIAQNALDFRILSPVKVSDLPVTIFYDVWGWWRT
jgi:hypothetical protein